MHTQTLSRAITAAVGAASLLAGAAVATSPPASAAPSPHGVVVASAAPGAAPDTRSVVDAWYRDFLDRDAEADPGSAYWVTQLDRGLPANVALQRILTSREAVTNAVGAIYERYLDRAPDAGAQHWVDGVVSGAFPVEWVEQNVAASGEYLTRTDATRGRGDVAVEGWYSVVVERTPSLGERAYWSGRIDRVGALAAYRELWYAPEVVAKRVQLHYSTQLGRSASPGEVAFWYDQEVASDLVVKAQVGGSTEYARRAITDHVPGR